jgi:hypothetical protein
VRERQAAEADADARLVDSMRAHWERLERDAAAAATAERERLARLREEVEEFNRLRRAELSEAERRERCAAGFPWAGAAHALGGSRPASPAPAASAWMGGFYEACCAPVLPEPAP